MTLEVRPARPEEFDEVGHVTALAYREFVRPGETAWEDYLEHIADTEGRADRTMILIAVEHGRVLGSATLELTDRIEDEGRPLHPEEAHVRMLGVHPDARRRGIAKLLMAGCEQQARTAGKAFLTLHTTQRMIAAQTMYASLGFEREEDHVFPDGFVLLGYSKRIVPGATGQSREG